MSSEYKSFATIFILALICATLLFSILTSMLFLDFTSEDNNNVFSVSGVVQDMQVNQNNFNITLINGTVSFRSLDVPVVLTVGERYMFFLHTDYFGVTYLDSYALVKVN